MNYTARAISFRRTFKDHKLDAFLVTKATNVAYLSGFKGNDSILVLTTGKRFFITDSRYAEESVLTLKGYDIRIARRSCYEEAVKIVRRYHLKRVGFESGNVSFATAHGLINALKGVRLVPHKGLIEDMRSIKEPDEICSIRASANITKDVLNNIIKRLTPGSREDALAGEIEISFIKKGASAAFEPIVASGRNASKPHAIPSASRLERNSMVMIDLGCTLNGYNSDLTRTIPLGKPAGILQKIYEVVREAQRLAIRKIRPGALISDVDKAARGYIKNRGYEKYFGHALGHGIGLDVHEQPAISVHSKGILKPGMVFTVEPAVYLPGKGGVRIEDMALVTDDGCELLT